jgi:hypothetical protein
MSKNLRDVRMCVEQTYNVLPAMINKAYAIKRYNPKVRKLQKHTLRSISSNKTSSYEKAKLKAAFVKNKLWENNSVINVLFDFDYEKYKNCPPGSYYDPDHDKNIPLGSYYDIKTNNITAIPNSDEPKRYFTIDGVKRTKYVVQVTATGSDGKKLPIDPLIKKLENEPIQEAIKIIAKERFEPISNLKFNFDNVSREDADIRIKLNPNNGSWSYIGTDSTLSPHDKESMNFAWYDVGTVIHEFGHAIGLIHEHQNPFGKPIDWNEEKVYNWASETQGWDRKKTYTNIIEKYDKTLLNGSEYDPYSIMLYFFGPELTNDGRGTQQNFILSKYDVFYINSVYPTENPNAAKEFYQKVYKQDLGEYDPIKIGGSESSTSDKDGKTETNPVVSEEPVDKGSATKATDGSEDDDKKKKIFIIAGVVIGILFIIMLLYFIL